MILLLLTVFSTLIGCSLIICTELLVEEIRGWIVQIVEKSVNTGKLKAIFWIHAFFFIFFFYIIFLECMIHLLVIQAK